MTDRELRKRCFWENFQRTQHPWIIIVALLSFILTDGQFLRNLLMIYIVFGNYMCIKYTIKSYKERR